MVCSLHFTTALVYSLHFALSQHFTRGLQSAVCGQQSVFYTDLSYTLQCWEWSYNGLASHFRVNWKGLQPIHAFTLIIIVN